MHMHGCVVCVCALKHIYVARISRLIAATWDVQVGRGVRVQPRCERFEAANLPEHLQNEGLRQLQGWVLDCVYICVWVLEYVCVLCFGVCAVV
jgi:hypothetical protein